MTIESFDVGPYTVFLSVDGSCWHRIKHQRPGDSPPRLETRSLNTLETVLAEEIVRLKEQLKTLGS